MEVFMSDIVLTQYSGAILGPIARFLGWIMNGIYVGIYNLFGIESVVLSIVLITIIIYISVNINIFDKLILIVIEIY